MGLVFVELVMDVEDHFGIVMDDDEAGRLHTVGDLVALIRSRVAATSSSACLSLSVFLSLRRLIRDIVGDDRMRLRPSQSIMDRLSHANRRRLWRRLPEILGTFPPPLRYPRTIRVVLFLLSVQLLIAAFAIASIDWRMLPLTLFVTGMLIPLLFMSTSSLRSVPRDSMATLGDVSRMIVGRSAVTRDLDLPDDTAILDELRPIVANTLMVDAEEIVPEARFVEDLGMC
jgi:acyl carrier protein